MERGFPSSREHAVADRAGAKTAGDLNPILGAAARRSWDPGRAAPPCPCQGHYKWGPSQRLKPTSPGKRDRCEGRAAQRREQALGGRRSRPGRKPQEDRGPRARRGGHPRRAGLGGLGAASRPKATQVPAGRASASRSRDARRRQQLAEPRRPL